MIAEQGRLHAARSLASGLAQFINTTAATLTHHGTIQIELQEACKAAFDRCCISSRTYLLYMSLLAQVAPLHSTQESPLDSSLGLNLHACYVFLRCTGPGCAAQQNVQLEEVRTWLSEDIQSLLHILKLGLLLSMESATTYMILSRTLLLAHALLFSSTNHPKHRRTLLPTATLGSLTHSLTGLQIY